MAIIALAMVLRGFAAQSAGVGLGTNASCGLAA
jgi:hypothetical protein